MTPAPWTYPYPTALIVIDGLVTDPDAVEYQVLDAAGDAFYPSDDDSEFAAASALGPGYYGASYVEAGPAGRRTVVWRYRLTSSGPWTSWRQGWERGRASGANPSYALVADLRDEGVTAEQAPPARAQLAISQASLMVGMYTGRVFGAYPATFLLDSVSSPILRFDQPVIAVSEVVLDAESLSSDEAPLDVAAYRVYNRHVSQGLLSPDDRNDPRVEIRTWGPSRGWPRRLIDSAMRGRFERGQQNVRVEGVWGYTEPDGSPTGGVPELIRRVTVLIALTLFPKATDADAQAESSIWRVVEERTRDQGVKYVNPMAGSARGQGGNALLGAFTGDPTIDTILAQYRRPPMMRAV